jgi:Fuc2NAc and GlcNAc transferase
MSCYAYRFGLLDIPNSRSSHSLPTPRGGGIGILAALIVSSFMLHLHIMIWFPAALLAIVSFFDDKLGLTPKTRLAFQFAAALAFSAFTLAIPDGMQIQNPEFIIRNMMLLLIFSIVIVGTANFYNFMDGINGIAAITGAAGFGLLALFASMQADSRSIALFATCIAAACIGFLPFNFPNARVFMGDVGSILLGFSFACFCLLLSRSGTDFLVLCSFLSTFYADALTTLYIRIRDGEKLSQAHRRHLYQLLANQCRIPHWQVSLGYGLVQLVVGCIMLALRPFGTKFVIVAFLSLCGFWCLVTFRIRKSIR